MDESTLSGIEIDFKVSGETWAIAICVPGNARTIASPRDFNALNVWLKTFSQMISTLQLAACELQYQTTRTRLFGDNETRRFPCALANRKD
jgi:hypothetical protein